MESLEEQGKEQGEQGEAGEIIDLDLLPEEPREGVEGLILTSPGLVEHLRKKAQKAQPPKDK